MKNNFSLPWFAMGLMDITFYHNIVQIEATEVEVPSTVKN